MESGLSEVHWPRKAMIGNNMVSWRGDVLHLDDRRQHPPYQDLDIVRLLAW